MAPKLLIALWLIIVGIAGWTAVTYWEQDKTAAWTSIALIVVITIAAFFVWRKGIFQ